MKKLVLLLAVLLVATAYLLLPGESPDLDQLRAWLAEAAAWREARPIATAALFFAGYVVVAALSLPLAVAMTLGAGALFGFGLGLLLVSFASSLGALAAFLLARYLFRDAVQRRLGHRREAIERGLTREGPFYLFSLRLLPVIPFFAINLLMGLTNLPALSFYGISQVGMLAGTAVYVNAGTQLAELDGLGGLLSPTLLLSFAALAAFPWIARAVLRRIRRRRVYRGWTRPRSFDRNLVVLGAGAAGLVSTYLATVLRARVTLVEGNRMGGDCLNYGCVPSKTLLRSARLAHEIRHAERFGLRAGVPEVSFRRVMERVHEVIARIAPHDSAERYEALGAEVLRGHGRLLDPWTVEITHADGSTSRRTARAIVLANGATPLVPPLPGLGETGYVTSDTLWERFAGRDEVPARLVVLGGGPIGSELSQAFARLGSSVTQVERGDRLLAREDPEVSAIARRTLEADGVRVRTGTTALATRLREDGEKELLVETGPDKAREEIPFDELLIAVGRQPRTAGYGLEELGIPAPRTVETNEYLQTLYPNILAAGDVAGPYQFTHTAAHQAWFATVNALFGDLRRFRAEYRAVPWTTFLDPEIGHLGLNEQEATARGVAYAITRYELSQLDRALTDGTDRGFLKVLTVPGKDRILGVTLVGEHAGDLLAEFTLAMRRGIGLNRILGTIHTYPTLSEANKYVAGEWKKAHAPQRLLALLERYHRWRRV